MFGGTYGLPCGLSFFGADRVVFATDAPLAAIPVHIKALDDMKLDPAGGEDGAMCAHGNANMLTHDNGTSKLSQGPSPGSNMVEIERWSGDVPPVRAFTPPQVVGAA
jgi:hypothetical protein